MPSTHPVFPAPRLSMSAGGRGYFLKGEGVLLNMALIQCALAHAVQQGCTPIMTPFFMRQDAMAACAQLDDFDEQLYKVSGVRSPSCAAAARQISGCLSTFTA